MAKKIYTVREGDYLTKIAAEQLGDDKRWSEIAYINELKQPYLIRPNDILLLPDDSDELSIVIPRGVKPQPNFIEPATPIKQAGFSVTPTTVLLALVGVAIYLLWDD